jgi:hypothetical protein
MKMGEELTTDLGADYGPLAQTTGCYKSRTNRVGRSIAAISLEMIAAFSQRKFRRFGIVASLKDHTPQPNFQLDRFSDTVSQAGLSQFLFTAKLERLN